MPGKNKPKRLDRARSWRVARRKKKQREFLTGNKRNRKPRPKHKTPIGLELKKELKKPTKEEQ